MIVPRETLDEIRTRADLVDLVAASVPLKRTGERWKGLCPFHQEKTASFTVHAKLGLYKCFGCGEHGDAFTWLMRHDRLEFQEAVRLLAERTGVALPVTEGESAQAALRDGQHALLDWATRRFERWLWEDREGERARRYLAERRLGEDTARRFRLGLAPAGWDRLLGAAREDGVALDALVGAGLALPRQTGSGHYDRFRGRLIFPIADTQGRVVAFGGRALLSEEPKYLNSPETALFQKGHTLYALHLGREAMARTRRALLVEGYVDCLMAHQAGFPETVAVLGTALTTHHLGVLRRYVDETVLFFDADQAGAEAARRAEDLLPRSGAPHWWALERKGGSFSGAGMRLRVATLPAGHDPDTYLREAGAEAFSARCSEARSLLLHVLDQTLGEDEAASPRGRQVQAARVALLLSKVQDPGEAIALGQEAARRLHIDASDLWLQAQRLASSAGAVGPPPPAGRPGAGQAPLPGSFDRDLVQCLVQLPEARRALAALIDVRAVAHPVLREIVEGLQEHPDAAPEALVGRLDGEPARALLTRFLVEERVWSEPGALIVDLRRRLEQRQGIRRVREMSQSIARAQADGSVSPTELVALTEEARRARAEREKPSPAGPPTPGHASGAGPLPGREPREPDAGPPVFDPNASAPASSPPAPVDPWPDPMEDARP